MNLTCFYILGYQDPINVGASHPFRQNATGNDSPTYPNIRQEHFPNSLSKKWGASYNYTKVNTFWTHVFLRVNKYEGRTSHIQENMAIFYIKMWCSLQIWAEHPRNYVELQQIKFHCLLKFKGN